MKNKVVHLSAIHCITFGNFTTLSPTGKLRSFIAKGSSSSYNMSSSLTGKKSLSSSLCFLFLYKKQKLVGLPKVTFGLPNVSFFPKSFYNLLNYNKADRSSYEEGPAWFSKNFLHAAASAARPSNELGSKN